MKQITLKNIGFPDKSSVYIKAKQFSVYLGNDTRCYFTSIREAKKFLAETNRFLNDKLHELNYVYVNMFKEYRNSWFFMKGFEYVTREAPNNFENLERFFENAINKSSGPNGNVFVFNNLFSICNELSTLINNVLSVLLKRKIFVDARRVKMYQAQVDRIRNDLMKYG